MVLFSPLKKKIKVVLYNEQGFHFCNREIRNGNYHPDIENVITKLPTQFSTTGENN